jgi:hypothetical protein
MFLFEFNTKPLIELDSIRCLLPSHDDIWENPELGLRGKMTFSKVTLSKAMEAVYMEKLLPPQLGEFSSALLVNAIYRNTKNILLKEHNHLSSWTPSAVAQRRISDSSTSMQSTWLPTDPTTMKWRNSACDCLDILHWSANSTVARRSGFEHHTILHLHLARLIILTPTEYIHTLVTTTVSEHQHASSAETRLRHSTAHHQILDWAVRDRCKARLSIVHCGALYWHIRRHRRDSILEPYAVYLATLVLWAFCVAMQLPEVVNAISQDSESDPEPRFLHLDRPLDDELVQTFVRAGHKMSAHICQVGNILDQGAPTKILQEGIFLLTGGSSTGPNDHSTYPKPALGLSPYDGCTWGIEESYVASRFVQDLTYLGSDAPINFCPTLSTGDSKRLSAIDLIGSVAPRSK